MADQGGKDGKPEATPKPASASEQHVEAPHADSSNSAKDWPRYLGSLFLLALFPAIVTRAGKLFLEPTTEARVEILNPNFYNFSFEALLVTFGILAANALRSKGPNVAGQLVLLAVFTVVIFVVSILLPNLSVIPSDWYLFTVVLPDLISIVLVLNAIGTEK